MEYYTTERRSGYNDIVENGSAAALRAPGARAELGTEPPPRSRHRDTVEDGRNDVLGRLLFRLGLVGDDHPVPTSMTAASGDATPALDAYSVTFALMTRIEYLGLSPSFVGCCSIMRTP